MPNTCASCKFAYGPIQSGLDAGQFWCRRFPPVGYHSEWRNSFPLVPSVDQWCGEYKRGTPTPTGATP